ncbi:hypothetical protein AB0K60_03220 [Thermopolyspora sp. NPDC052614]|uniref:hypothetical protein n=1 Tax=Thermopolyspora sp. NPDC052614 TaxID=3155682 RepID=UPI0034341BB7
MQGHEHRIQDAYNPAWKIAAVEHGHTGGTPTTPSGTPWPNCCCAPPTGLRRCRQHRLARLVRRSPSHPLLALVNSALAGHE